jgi:hypothetical protein
MGAPIGFASPSDKSIVLPEYFGTLPEVVQQFVWEHEMAHITLNHGIGAMSTKDIQAKRIQALFYGKPLSMELEADEYASRILPKGVALGGLVTMRSMCYNPMVRYELQLRINALKNLNIKTPW